MSLKRNLDELVYETICQGFVGGTYTAGKRLDPAELSERYQVSKTPVIQALKRMAHERIVEITSGGKYIIPVATRREIENVCQARLLFEEDALMALCSTENPDAAAVLTAIEEKCRGYYEAGSYDQYFMEDMCFHRKIVELAGNGCLSDLYHILINRYMVIRSTTGTALVHDPVASKEHAQMIQAIKDRDRDKAKCLIENHIYEMEERLNEKVD